MLIPQLAIFLQRLINNLFQTRRNLRIQPQCRDRRAIQYRVKNHRGSIPAKRHRARRHLIQNRAERKKICPCVQLFPLRLLRRHIRHRTNRRPRTGQKLLAHPGRNFHSPRAHEPGRRRDLGQPKIQNLRVPPLGNKKIGRLDIAMNNPLTVRRIQRISNLNR